MTRITRRGLAALAGASALTLSAPALLRAQSAGRMVVIGGGFGGASAARFASIHYPEVEVTLVEPQPTFITCPYGNLILGGKRTLADITHSYDGLVARGIEVIHDRAVGIDPDAHSAQLANGTVLDYDKLILSPGIALRWGAIEGYDEAAADIFPHADRKSVV